MDNIYRRDHEMAYISDDAVVAQQKETKTRQRIRNLRTAVRLSGNPGSPGNFGRRSLFARRPGFGQKSEVSTNPQLFPTNRRFNKKIISYLC